MNDFDVIAYVRDTMLTDPFIDADLVWSIAKLAEEDDDMYDMMAKWMSEGQQSNVLNDMKDYLVDRGLF